MKIGSRRRQARAAERRARSARARLHSATDKLRLCWKHDRAPWIVGTGAVSGIVAALLPTRAWTRLGALLFGAGSLLLRSPVGGVLLGSMLRAHSAKSTESANDDA
ncbi:MAG: hypothetical protein WB784_06475 [Rhodanobacteraceae bacterium]